MPSRNNAGAAALQPPDARIYATWLKSHHVIATAATLIAIVVGLALAFIQFERREKRADTMVQLQRLAKSMENQTNASMSAVQSMLLMLANSEQSLLDRQAPGNIQTLTANMVRSYPQLRSLSMVNASGHVIASTTPDNVNVLLNFNDLGARPSENAKVTMGSVLHLRDLSDLVGVANGADRTTTAKAFNVIPLMVRLGSSVTPNSNSDTLLLALVNLDYFSAEYESVTNNPSIRIALTSYQGNLMVATENITRPSGTPLGHLPAFTDFLPQREWGSYIDAGISNSHVITAFSTLRQWPMVVVVEESYDEALKEVWVLQRGTITLVLAISLGIAILSYFSLQSLQRHTSMRKQLTHEVYTSEARHNAVLESSLDAVITVDSKATIVAFNPAAEQIFGYGKADCIGKPMEILLTPIGLQQVQQLHHIATSGDSQSTFRLETTARHAEGHSFSIELSLIAVRVDEQLFFTANVRDISEQKQAALEMDQLLRKYHAVATDLEQQKIALDQHAIVSIVDPDNTILYANDKLIEISGYSREELLGRKLHEFRKPLAPDVYAQMRKHQAEGKIWHGELHKRHRDGSSYWVANTTVPVFGNDGKLRQNIAIQTDITGLRRAEMALKAAHDREVDTGNRIQQTLLSASPEHQIPGLWFSHYNQASKGIDGDFVDVIELGAGCVDIIVGDVMGKGVPAALLGAATKLQFSRSLAQLLADPKRKANLLPEPKAIVSAVHRAMTPHLQVLEAFVTLAYIRMDLERNTISWVGCGHEESLLIRANGDSRLLPNQHPPLGILDSSDYNQDNLDLHPHDVVFLCSDGLTDAIGPDGQRLGRDYINATVRDLVRTHPTPLAALQSLRSQVLQSNVQLTDDVTMALMIRPGNEQRHNRCELPIALGSIRQLRQFVNTNIAQAGLSETHAAMFELASVEVFTNIVRHAQGLLTNAPLEMLAHYNERAMTLEIIYLGQAFTPPEDPIEPDLSTLPEGGFGLSIIRSACSQVEFLHNAGVNTVRLVRDIAITEA